MLIACRVPIDSGLHKRLASVEKSVDELFACVKNWNATSNESIVETRKRNGTEAFGNVDWQDDARSVGDTLSYSIVPTPSAQQGRRLIRNELNQIPIGFRDKRNVLLSALVLLKDNLNMDMNEILHSDEPSPKGSLEHCKIPDPSLVQWMLQCKL
jgi:hypothetical protein